MLNILLYKYTFNDFIHTISFSFSCRKVIHTRADGRTVIEVWTNGERVVRDQDQVVRQGTEEAEVVGSIRQSSADDFITSPKFNEPVRDVDEVQDPVTEAPDVAGSDENVFLTKLRNAIRYFFILLLFKLGHFIIYSFFHWLQTLKLNS